MRVVKVDRHIAYHRKNSTIKLRNKSSNATNTNEANHRSYAQFAPNIFYTILLLQQIKSMRVFQKYKSNTTTFVAQTFHMIRLTISEKLQSLNFEIHARFIF
jgi:hypothetical protein